MDAISIKKLDILKAFSSLVDSGADVTPYIQSNVKMMLDCCYDDNMEVVSATVSLITKVAKLPKCRQALLVHGAITTLVDASSTVPEEVEDAILVAIENLKSDAGVTPADIMQKKETRGVQLNMDGLLGRRDHEDEYIKALLLVDGVTSVTLDRTRSIAIVFTSEEREMKSSLYDVVQKVCDGLRDAAGLRRISVKKNDHATYLDDEEEEEEDFFAEGSKTIVKVNKGEREARTADDRFRERDAAATAAPAAANNGLLGWLRLW